MVKNKTSRSSDDGKPWKCRCGTLNNPTKHRFFNLPAFQCSNCGRKLSLDFKFCLGEIEVGGKSLTGEVRDQEQSPFCVAFACSKAAEVTERVFSVRNGTDPESVVPIDPFALEERFVEKFPSVPSHDALTQNRGVHKVLHMGLILRAEGCRRVRPEEFENNDEPYKAPDVSTVPRDSFEKICQALAEGGERSLQHQSEYDINKVNYILMTAEEKQYSAQMVQRLREKANSEFVPSGYVDDGVFRDDEGGVCPQTCCVKSQALKVIKKLIEHFPIKRAPLRVRFTAPKLNFTGLMERVAERNATVISKHESGTQPSIVCEIEPTILHSCEERLKDVQGRVEVWSVSAHAEGGPSVEQHDSVEVPQAAPAKEPDAVAQISETMQEQSISSESQGSAQGKQQRRCKELNLTGLMEKVDEQNATVISKDESGTQPSIVCEIEPSILHACERVKGVPGRVEVRSVSVHAEGGPSVEQHDSVEVPQAAPAKGPDAVAQISETMQKQSISTESQGSPQGKQQRRCKERDVLVEDKLYREHSQSGWHKHNYTRYKNGLPPLSQEECMVEIELAGSKEDLKDYDF